MTTTGIPTLDQAPLAAGHWLDQLCEALGWPSTGADRARAYLVLRETLHALRDFLTVDEAADLAAQLPLLIRGVFYEGWDPSATPVHPRGKAAFLDRVTARLTTPPLPAPEAAVTAVFDLLRAQVSEGEITQVRQALRQPLRALWD